MINELRSIRRFTETNVTPEKWIKKNKWFCVNRKLDD
jgi:hypothetical protein